MPAHSVNVPVQDAAGDGDGVEAGGEKRLAALGLVFSTACLQRCQRNERAMRIRREKCLGWFTFPVGTGGWPHGGRWQCLPRTCPLLFLRST